MAYKSEEQQREYNRIKQQKRRERLKAATEPTPEPIAEPTPVQTLVEPEPEPQSVIPVEQKHKWGYQKPVEPVKKIQEPEEPPLALQPIKQPPSLEEAKRQLENTYETRKTLMFDQLWETGWAFWKLTPLITIIIRDDKWIQGFPAGYPVFTVKELEIINQYGTKEAWEAALLVKKVEPTAEVIGSELTNG